MVAEGLLGGLGGMGIAVGLWFIWEGYKEAKFQRECRKQSITTARWYWSQLNPGKVHPLFHEQKDDVDKWFDRWR